MELDLSRLSSPALPSNLRQIKVVPNSFAQKTNFGPFMNNSKLQSAPNSNSRQIQILLDSNSCRIQNRTRFKFVPDSNSRTIQIRTQLKFAHNSNSRSIQIRTQVNKYPSSHFHCASEFNHRTGTYVRLLGPCFKTVRMKLCCLHFNVTNHVKPNETSLMHRLRWKTEHYSTKSCFNELTISDAIHE